MTGTVVRLNLGEALKEKTKPRTSDAQRERSRRYYQKNRELIGFKRSWKVRNITVALEWLWSDIP